MYSPVVNVPVTRLAALTPTVIGAVVQSLMEYAAVMGSTAVQQVTTVALTNATNIDLTVTRRMAVLLMELLNTLMLLRMM